MKILALIVTFFASFVANGKIIRPSWTSLADSTKQEIMQGIIDLKSTLSPWPYDHLCHGAWDPGEPKRFNAYDYFVTAHLQAFFAMDGMDHKHSMMTLPHMGPQFLPWHREFLRRFEIVLSRALEKRYGDRYRNFGLPYWNWMDEPQEVFGSTHLGKGNFAPHAFRINGKVKRWDGDPSLLDAAALNAASAACGSTALTPKSNVSGFLTEQGFRVNLYQDIFRSLAAGNSIINLIFSPDSLVCKTRKLKRLGGCQIPMVHKKAISSMMATESYDLAPYNRYTDHTKSFRAAVEGFTPQDDTSGTIICSVGGCRTHGQVHVWVGGDMASGASPNDPVFFLHHSNVDRLWAKWQKLQCKKSKTDQCNPDYPKKSLGDMFWFGMEREGFMGKKVTAKATLDFCKMGYRYHDVGCI